MPARGARFSTGVLEQSRCWSRIPFNAEMSRTMVLRMMFVTRGMFVRAESWLTVLLLKFKNCNGAPRSGSRLITLVLSMFSERSGMPASAVRSRVGVREASSHSSLMPMSGFKSTIFVSLMSSRVSGSPASGPRSSNSSQSFKFS